MSSALLERAQRLHQSGQLEAAERLYLEILQGENNLDARHGLALLYNQTGRDQDAVPLLHAILEEAPGSISSRLVLARCLANLGRSTDAVEQCELAKSGQPENPAAWTLAAQLQQQAGDAEAALANTREAIALDSSNGPAWYNQGIALATLGRQEGALAAYEEALRVMPAAARVYYNYALALQAVGREADAVAALGRALELRPGMTDARLRRLHLMLLHCDWRDLEAETERLVGKLESLLEKDVIGHLSLHILNLLDVPRELHRQLARRMARGIARQASSVARPTTQIRDRDQRIRLAYLSPDLGAHAVGGLLQDFFPHHDQSQFNVCIFSLRDYDDAVARAIRTGAPQFVDLAGLSLAEGAQRIADFGPDILVDLGGYTQGARNELLAMRLAPRQVSWLGYLNTMGADFIDYLIADEVVVPEDDESCYDEQVTRLPRCFLPFAELAENPAPFARSDFGLPDAAFVLASFNNPCKVQPREFRAWISILREAPDAVLWIYDGGRESVRNNLRAAFALSGLGKERLIFAATLPMHEHLQRMRLADLFLDTFRYNAGATAIAAAQVALPILTLKGQSLLGRMGASVNHALGLDDLVCESVEDYVRRAVELTRDRDRLARARDNILAARERSGGLFDTAGFVTDLESLFRQLHSARAEQQTR